MCGSIGGLVALERNGRCGMEFSASLRCAERVDISAKFLSDLKIFLQGARLLFKRFDD